MIISPLFRYQWKTFQWSKCSEDCEGGNQTRQVECRGVLGGHVVNNSLCSTEKPETKKRCNDEPCPADWVVGNWSKVLYACVLWYFCLFSQISSYLQQDSITHTQAQNTKIKTSTDLSEKEQTSMKLQTGISSKKSLT